MLLPLPLCSYFYKKAMPTYTFQQHRFITNFHNLPFAVFKKESDVKNYTYIVFKSQYKPLIFQVFSL